MHSQTRRLSTMMGTVASVMLLAFVTSVTWSQAAEPTAPSPSQKKAVKKGDPGEVQEPTVSLTQAVHFTDATGQDAVVGPGSYRVDAEGTNRIRLLPAGTGGAVVIDAVSFTHQQPVEHPVSFITTPDSQQPDVLNLALLLPGGHGVGAVGTYSGVKPRAVTNWAAVYALSGFSYVPPPPSDSTTQHWRRALEVRGDFGRLLVQWREWVLHAENIVRWGYLHKGGWHL